MLESDMTEGLDPILKLLFNARVFLRRAAMDLGQRDDKPKTQGRIGMLFATELVVANRELRTQIELMEKAINNAAAVLTGRSTEPSLGNR